MRSVSPPCRTCRTPRSNSGQPLQHMLRVFRDMHMHRFSRTLLPIHLDIQEQHAGRKGSLRSTALRSSTRTLSLPSVFRGLGPAEISQSEDLNRRESRGGAYTSRASSSSAASCRAAELLLACPVADRERSGQPARARRPARRTKPSDPLLWSNRSAGERWLMQIHHFTERRSGSDAFAAKTGRLDFQKRVLLFLRNIGSIAGKKASGRHRRCAA